MLFFESDFFMQVYLYCILRNTGSRSTTILKSCTYSRGGENRVVITCGALSSDTHCILQFFFTSYVVYALCHGLKMRCPSRCSPADPFITGLVDEQSANYSDHGIRDEESLHGTIMYMHMISSMQACVFQTYAGPNAAELHVQGEDRQIRLWTPL